jgi:hypothetical protein
MPDATDRLRERLDSAVIAMPIALVEIGPEEMAIGTGDE